MSAVGLLIPTVSSPAAPGPQDPAVAPPEFIDLASLDTGIALDIRYAGRDNFVGRPLAGYEAGLCLLTREAAHALAAVQQEAAALGYGLLVYDAYRPARAVAHIERWAADPDDQDTKAEYYPNLDKSRLFHDGYIHARSGHSRGGTVDVTLVHPCGTPVDMGTGFDCFDTRSHTLDPRTTGPRRAHRLLLKSAMERAGFVNLPEEWWHFTHRSEPYPDTYFDFPVARSSLARPGALAGGGPALLQSAA
ncbi:M15 family metallopeptidase [Streptomyces bambusae]|uniref:M15 family metallopeptidase n=1 Tax=Streptomyces bambusae TaxID=1550616 RepID=UPI001D000508|nr:M15 family metallopeptidase [Streptomyces bambusae]MCB5169074.1 M15 family metallopeptidase [Streptomyces bambusae]